jgi:hypothetical protein
MIFNQVSRILSEIFPITFKYEDSGLLDVTSTSHPEVLSTKQQL